MKQPFVNLFDIAGILMLTILLAVPFWLLGSTSITGLTILVLVVLFIGAVFFAKRGSP